MSCVLGNWITNGKKTSFYVRKKILINKKVKKAEAKVCGLGQFHFWVNGEKAGDNELDPGWTNYHKMIQFVRFDVTEDLQVGENVIGAEVGNGWYIMEKQYYTFEFPEFMPPNPNPYKPFGKNLVFAMELVILYEDDETEVIRCDESFLVKDHPVIMSNVYGSEIIDGRKNQTDWSKAEFDDTGWGQAKIVAEKDEPQGKLTEQFQPAVKVIQTYNGMRISQSKENKRKEFDFGQNISGILEFEIKGRRGDIVKFYPAEKLGRDGHIDQMAKGWKNIDSCIAYIIGKNDTWEKARMKFTYFAGRYVEVEYIPFPDNAAESYKMELRALKAYAISSAYEQDGTFICDDKRYEQIYNLVEKAVEANMLSVHTDCPTIERFAWQEVNHLMAPSIMYMKNCDKIWQKILLDMRTDQLGARDYFYDFDGNRIFPGEGLMPSQCPCYIPNVLPVPGMGSFYDTISWGSTCILGTYWHYQFYGKKTIIEENYAAGMKYLQYLSGKINENGFIAHGLGDWGNPEGALVRENIETATLYADIIVLEKFAEILGKENDKNKLNKFAEKVKKNYNEKLLIYDEKEGFWCYKAWDHPNEIYLVQSAQALPLYWGLVPEEKREDVVKAFRWTLETKGAFCCGEIGHPYVIQTAAKYGMNSLITRFILNEHHPSYYAFVVNGETTLGEYWEENPRSHCHDMMGHIIEWYYNGIAGIQLMEPGFSKVRIQPYLPESMHCFSCSYKSVRGTISVKVEESREDKEVINLEIIIPESIRYMIGTEQLRGKEVRVFVNGEKLLTPDIV